MKKLSSFEAMNARFFDKRPHLTFFAFVGSLLGIIVGTSMFLMLYPKGKYSVGIFIFSVSVLLMIQIIESLVHTPHLPEKIKEQAEKLMKDHLEAAGALEPLLKEGDLDGDLSELKNVVEKLQKMFSLQDQLENRIRAARQEAREINQQIIHLKVELGLA